MARRSVLSPARDAQAARIASEQEAALQAREQAAIKRPSETPQTIRPSRIAKLHVGGYFDPLDPVVMAFQKLKVDLRRSQQDMLLEALTDFVAKHEAELAFRHPLGRGRGQT